ncbi:hypothetical protein M9H77_32669 [Catharanthus roseus]|uniref:Uncharacterized protein n=1 Tax=Catharanthus roseus TaxID=4058 RepID=A0ACC0A3K4_CATRO|nr:hypothetical protein M9H77_32669 [Catharanthus roseus]
MFFFIEFSIPWVWKWTPDMGYTQQNIPCLRRATHSRFWDRLKLQKDVISKEDIIKSYMEELKKELVKNLLPEDKTDVSMTGSSNENCLAGESQDPDMDDFSEADIDHMVKDIEDAARKEIK